MENNLDRRKIRITLKIPLTTIPEIEKTPNASGEIATLPDFIREAVKEKIERWRKENP